MALRLARPFGLFARSSGKRGVMTDLNTLVDANPANLYLIQAVSINSRGEIIGLAVDGTGLSHRSGNPKVVSVARRGAKMMDRTQPPTPDERNRQVNGPNR